MPTRSVRKSRGSRWSLATTDLSPASPAAPSLGRREGTGDMRAMDALPFTVNVVIEDRQRARGATLRRVPKRAALESHE